MSDPAIPEKHAPRVLALKAVLLAAWAVLSFVGCFFARDLQLTIGHWPFGYWMAAQGAILAFIGITAFYAWAMQRLAPEDGQAAPDA
jgi:putative solute:sodium symporter small subunit